MLWCTKNSRVAILALKVSNVGLVTSSCTWDLVPESYGRHEVGSAANVCSAEWDHVFELMTF